MAFVVVQHFPCSSPRLKRHAVNAGLMLLYGDIVKDLPCCRARIPLCLESIQESRRLLVTGHNHWSVSGSTRLDRLP